MQRRLLAFVPVLAALALGCPGGPHPVVPSSGGHDGSIAAGKSARSGPGFHLSDADEDGQGKPTAPAKTTPLTPAETQAVLARLPALPPEPGDAKEFAMRSKTLPAPRTGKTVQETFPPPSPGAPPPAAAGGALTVARHSPEGAVDLAPYVSLTFSEPMVAITSHDDLAKTPPPVTLRPAPPGAFRWVGTQTVLFEPKEDAKNAAGDTVKERTRLPMATEYTIDVPAGTRAANGDTLAQGAHFSFTTPPPKVTSSYPVGQTPVKLDPTMFLAFDQKIDPAAMLASIELRAAGGGTAGVRLATDDEVQSDRNVASLVRRARANRFLALKPASRLRGDTRYTLVVKKGAPSAEGPLRTDHDQSYEFVTFGPLKVLSSRCGWQNDCPPFTPFDIELSNPIASSFDKKLVKVDPPIPNLKVSHYGTHLEIFGRTQGRTTYRVTLSSATSDVFDQTLGRDEKMSFDVGPAKPTLFPEERPMAVLDPAGGTSVPVFSVNESDLRVRLYAVAPEDWPAYLAWRKQWDYERKTTTPPGRLVMNRVVTTHAKPEELTATDVALDPALTQKLGQVIVVVEPAPAPPKDTMVAMYRSWVQVTKLGVEAMVDADEVLAWTSDLASGAPTGGVALNFLAGGRGAVTSGADGLAHLPLPDSDGALVVARKGGDVALLAEGIWGSNLKRAARTDQVRWFVFDDRGMYKPGEEAHVKGWVRRSGMGRGGDIGKVGGALHANYRVRDARGNEYAKGTADLDASEGFELSFKVPDNVNLGPSMVSLELDGVSGLGPVATYHRISVQEFRRPEFEVHATAEEGPHVVRGHGVATVSAKYYAGGGLPNADVTWNVTRSDGSFTPPNQHEFVFGRPFDPWMGWFTVRRGKPGEAEDRSVTWSAKTDSEGAHRLRVDFDGSDPPYAMSLNLQASVTDVNRQQWSASTTMLVHPANVYVGLKPVKNFVRAGEPITFDAIVVDLDGKPVPGRHVTIESSRLEVEQEGDEFVEKEHDGAAAAYDSAAGASRTTLATKEPGRYRVRAVVTDAEGRKSQTELYTWVTGDEIPIGHGLPEGSAQLVLDKKEYKGGDVAEVLVMAPFGPAEGIVTVGRQGMVRSERFSLRGSSGTIQVKIDPAWVPNAFVRVDLAGAAPRNGDDGNPDPKLPKRPAHASGVATLVIPPVDRTLALHVVPSAPKVEPGARTEIDVEVKDALGRPAAGTTLAVVVADEAILALSDYKLADPLALFYAARSEDVRTLSLRTDVLLADPSKLSAPGGLRSGRAATIQADDVMIQGAYGGAPGAPPLPMSAPAPMASAAAPPALAAREEASPQPTTPISVRQDFNPIAAFVPRVVTDARGHVKVPVKLPDNLTRYRVMAVAVNGDRDFGSGESTITARLPLMVRPSAPRFLNFGDRFELPVVLQNQTDQPLQVDVAARASNAVVEPVGKRVTVPANDRVEVRLASAAAKPGTARFQIGAASGRYADAAKIELPVWTPATTEAFATYGQVDEGAVAQKVKAPSAVVRDFGGLEISTSSTALSSLTDAIIYLVRYPFECNEQLASRVLGIVALKDVLAAFHAKDLPPPAELTASVDKDIALLKARQRYDGGWGFWAGSPEDWPYLSIHVAHALARAKEKGFTVPPQMISSADGYLKNIERHIPGYYGPDERRSLIAYALFVRHLLADTDRVRARALVAEAGGADKLPIEADGWLLRVLTSDPGSQKELGGIRRALANRVTETAGAAHFTTHYADGEHLLLASDRRADGVILESLIFDQPQSDVIPKVVAGLLAHRTAGHWVNTQENAFVLLALDRYFRTYEKATPSFVARAWLGDKFAGEHAFQGRTTEQSRIDVPMSFVLDQASHPTDLVIQKDGAGRLYYRVGMQYAPSDLRLPPADHGFTVSRVYEAVDDPSDVKRDADGTWHVKAGAKVRVRVAMIVPARRYHVALVDPLPAGFEAMNSDLAVTGAVPSDPKSASPGRGPWWWFGTWYEHQNLRDERVEAFASLVWDGVYDYTYVARATTPGTFVVPPSKAEEMYAPETFGRGAGDKVVVE